MLMIHVTKEYFNWYIDYVVYEKLKQYDNFYLLMKYNDGIHPISLLDSLRRLYKEKRIRKATYKHILQSAHASGLTPGEDSTDILPVPHILDYDWRFSMQSIRHLYKKIRSDAPRKGTIVFLGTPSLWKYCARLLPDRLQLILIDINANKHLKGMKQTNISGLDIDINKKSEILPKIYADIIIMDPPWYLNYYRLFFARANEMTHYGTLIYCVMPPRFTRVKAQEETEELLVELSDQYGLEKVSYHTGDVTYHTPPFEKNVLRSHGIECLPPNWRIGDLLVVRKSSMGNGYDADLTIVEEQWDEYSVDAIRIKVKREDEVLKSYAIHLVPLYKNNIYPSVKRSFSNKKNVNVWTSGNRVFWCDNIPLLNIILSQWGKPWIDIEISEEDKKSIGEVQTLLENIIETEMAEYGKDWRDYL